MTLDQITGPLRAILPVACTMAVAYHLLPQDIAAQLPDSIIAAVTAVGGLVTLGVSVWSWIANSRTSQTKKVSEQEGVHVIVGPTAAPDLKELAADPAAPSVKAVP